MRIKRRVDLKDADVIRVKVNLSPFSIRIVCCDCGLSHDLKFLQTPDDVASEEMEMIFKRNKISTALHRRHRRINAKVHD